MTTNNNLHDVYNLFDGDAQQQKHTIYNKLTKHPLMITNKFLKNTMNKHPGLIDSYVNLWQQDMDYIGLAYLLITKTNKCKHKLKQYNATYNQISLDKCDNVFMYNNLCADAVFGFVAHNASYATLKYKDNNNNLTFDLKKIDGSDVFFLSDFTYEKPLFVHKEQLMSSSNWNMYVETDGDEVTCNIIWIDLDKF
jgi:hypothetical protein